MAQTTANAATSAYLRRFLGGFRATLSWAEFDALWTRLKGTPYGWYVYPLDEQPPATALAGADFIGELDAIASYLRREHRERYCGIVYADDPHAPAMVKVFDPHHLGVVCGLSKGITLPGWVLSRQPPPDLVAHFAPRPTGFWGRLKLTG